MVVIETGSVNPYVNLAFEEYFLKSKDLGDDILMLWQNEPSIVVGRFQNTLEEINQAYVDAYRTHVVRRISGGGSVYHDLGNLCFTFILRGVSMGTINAARYAQPVMKALAEMGIQVELSRRNDLIIDGKKISGHAMALHKERLLYHGTLLYESNLEVLSQVLTAGSGNIQSKGIKSFKSLVTNIRPYTRLDMDIFQFKQQLQELIAGSEPLSYRPTSEDLVAILELVESKYHTWEWNFGSNPHSILQYSGHYPGGNLECDVEVEKGAIKSIHFTRDLQGEGDFGEIEQQLMNVRYVLADVSRALEGVNIGKRFGSITKAEVVNCLMRR